MSREQLYEVKDTFRGQIYFHEVNHTSSVGIRAWRDTGHTKQLVGETGRLNSI